MAKPNNKTNEQKDIKMEDTGNAGTVSDTTDMNKRKSFNDWASDERLPSWKIASILAKQKITADKMVTKNEFQSVCKGRGQ